jgi:hypothetical protein
MSMVNVKNLGFGGTGIPDALPKAVAELQGMKMQVVTGAAANTVVPVSGMDPEDHIGSVVNLTDLVDVALSTISIAERNAKATITALTTAVDGDKVTVNGRVYTVKDVIVSTSYNTPPGVIPVDITPSGTDAEVLAKRTAQAIMSGDATLTASVGLNAASPPAMVVITVKVRQPGTAGNAYTLTETGNGFTVSGATFAGGSAVGGGGFSSSTSLAGKKLLVCWYDKAPGMATNPLLFQALEASDKDEDYELTVSELEPSSAEIGDESFTLHVHGTGFGPEAKIIFNGHEEPTTFVSTTELTTGVNMDVWKGASEPLPVKVRTSVGDESNEEQFQFFAAGETPADRKEEAGKGRGRRKPGGNLTFKNRDDDRGKPKGRS